MNIIKKKKLVNVRRGGVLLVLDPSEDKKRMVQKILERNNLRVSEPLAIRPRIILYDVPSELNQEELSLEIYNRNFQNVLKI